MASHSETPSTVDLVTLTSLEVAATVMVTAVALYFIVVVYESVEGSVQHAAAATRKLVSSFRVRD